MLRFAANLSFLYQEYPFPDRFAAAANDAFQGVEYLFTYEYKPEYLADLLAGNRLMQVLFNAPPGDWNRGERGIAALPGREAEFQRSITIALQYAEVLGNKLIHVMAGIVNQDKNRAEHKEVYMRNLAYAAEQAAAHDISILIEPINSRDMPGYFLNYQAEAHDICGDIGACNLKVQADLYHCQIVEGDLTAMLRKYIHRIGHIQIAGVPERHEPDTGEVNYPDLFEVIDQLNYPGWIGCEYRPRAGTSAGLGWRARYDTSGST